MQEVKGSETVTYQYDALKRLISSSATPVTGSTPAAWTQTFQYDGFGNLTGKVLSGTATAIPVDNTTNRLTNATYDNNGNMLTGSVNGSGVTLGYDGANRMISATKYSGGTELYGYAPDNKRIVTVPADGSSPVWTLWGPQGQKLGDFNIVGNFVGSGVQTWSNFTGYVSVVGPTLYFAGRKIWEQGADGEWNTTAVNNGGSVVTDRLGSAGVYLPYGDTNGSAAGGRSFATYARGSLTGLDYADQRFYASSYGRFNSPDPSKSSLNPRNPDSWNHYAYVLGDPVNKSDQHGTHVDCDDDDCSEANCDGDSVACSLYEQNSSDDGGGANCNSVIATGCVDPVIASVTSCASGVWNGTSCVNQPPCEPQQTGLGGGLIAGGSVALGGGPGMSAGGTASYGEGVFVPFSGAGFGTANQGSFASAGGFLSPTGSMGNYPPNSSGKTPPNFAIGSSAGLGGGAFITNAGNSATLRGPFTTIVLTLPLFSIEVDYGGGIGAISVTGGPYATGPGSLMVLQTNTLWTSGTPCP